MANAPEKLKYSFGLLGKNIDYSFSRGYFNAKFKEEGLPYTYENFDLNHISELPSIIDKHPNLKGLNVTIPYKEEIIPFLNGIDKRAKSIGAVNTIRLSSQKQLIGYNTDYLGFKKSIHPYLNRTTKPRSY